MALPFLHATVVLLQLLIWPSLAMITWACLNLICVVSFFLVMSRKRLRRLPVASVMVAGYLAYYLILPGLATLLEGKPVLNNLANPVGTLIHIVIAFFSILAAFLIYGSSPFLRGCRSFICQRVYRPVGYFEQPSPAVLFMIGSFGLAAIALNAAALYDSEGSLVTKVLEGMYPLAFVPYCSILFSAQRADYSLNGKQRLLLLLYTGLLLAAALLRNSRSAFFLGIASVGLAYIYSVFAGLAPSPRAKRVALSLLVIACLAGPMTELAISMTVARASKGELSSVQLAEETFRIYLAGDAAKLASLLSEGPSAWDERYVDNVFLARLANLKFADKALELVEGMTEGQRARVREVEFARVLALLPAPLLNALGAKVEKSVVMSGSGGDFLFATATGDAYAVGAYRTGSMLASLYASFGVFYPVVLFAIALVLFPAADALSIWDANGLRLSPVLITSFFSWFFFFTSAATGAESLSALLQFPVRGWIQQLLIYGCVFGLCTLAVRIMVVRGRSR